MIYFSLAMTHNPVTVNNCLSHHLIGEQFLQNGSLSYHNESLSLYQDPVLHHNLLLSFSIFHIPNTLIHCPITDVHFLITMIHTVIHCLIIMVYVLLTITRVYCPIKNTNILNIIPYSTMSKTFCFIIMVQSHISCNNG